MNENTDSQTLYKCTECGLHYKEEATAQQCEAWCKDTKSCNLDITKHSVESQRN